jgi:hypothetical protein
LQRSQFTIILNGQIIGTWKRTIKKDKVIIEPQFFDDKIRVKKEEIERIVQPFAVFLDKKDEVL